LTFELRSEYKLEQSSGRVFTLVAQAAIAYQVKEVLYEVRFEF